MIINGTQNTLGPAARGDCGKKSLGGVVQLMTLHIQVQGDNSVVSTVSPRVSVLTFQQRVAILSQNDDDNTTQELSDFLKQYCFQSESLNSLSFTPDKSLSFREIGEAINRESQRLYGRNPIHPMLLERCCKDTVLGKGETHTATRTEQPGVQKTQKPVILIKKEAEMGSFASLAVAVVNASLYRLLKGFPENPDDIGTEHDLADWFKGAIALVEPDRGISSTTLGSGFGGIRSSVHGIVGGPYKEYWLPAVLRDIPEPDGLIS